MPIIGGRQIGVRGLGFQGAGKPSAPTSVSATDVGTGRAYNNGAATVSWTAPSSNGAPITSYTVISSPGGYTATTSSTSVQVTGLQSSVSYTYSVTATNAVGVSDAGTSSAVTATTVPQSPTIGAAIDADTGNSVTVAYTAGATGGKSVSTYTAISSPGSFTGTGASPITVSGLTTGTSYTFTVAATNANGTSAASAASNSVAPRVPPSFDSIASFSPTSGTSVTFSSIPSTYKSLQLRIKYMTNDSNSSVFVQFNGSSASSYTTNVLEGNGSTVSASIPFGGATTALHLMPSSSGTLTAGVPNVIIVDLIDYQSTSKPKTIKYQGGKDNNGNTTASISWLGAGVWQDTAAVSSVTVAGPAMVSGSEISLYGIKG
jgi:hypothetical protein